MTYSLIGVKYALTIYFYVMSLDIIISWIPSLYQVSFFRFINKISQWYMQRFRGVVTLGAFDFTPLIGLLIYSFILGMINLF